MCGGYYDYFLAVYVKEGGLTLLCLASLVYESKVTYLDISAGDQGTSCSASSLAVCLTFAEDCSCCSKF